jgi:hypothetical protein
VSQRRSSPEPRPLSEPRKVNHGLQVTVFALLFGVAIPLMAIQELLTQGWESQLVIVGAAVLAGPPAWLVVLEWRFRVVVGPGGIDARSVIGERRVLPWKSIRRVEFGPITRTLVFEAGDEANRVVLRVSLLRRGIEALGHAIPHYLPEETYRDAWDQMFGRPG